MQARGGHKQQLLGLETEKLRPDSVQRQVWRCSGRLAGSASFRWLQASIEHGMQARSSTVSMQASSSHDQQPYRNTGDFCLQLPDLFPATNACMLKERHVKKNYCFWLTNSSTARGHVPVKSNLHLKKDNLVVFLLAIMLGRQESATV